MKDEWLETYGLELDWKCKQEETRMSLIIHKDFQQAQPTTYKTKPLQIKNKNSKLALCNKLQETNNSANNNKWKQTKLKKKSERWQRVNFWGN